MASLDFRKATSSYIGSMKRHLDTKERMTRSHANKDIDISRTEQNYFVGCSSWDDMYKSWKDRTKEADELHPPTRVRSDRVTGVMVEVPCPWEIALEGNEKAFFDMVLEHLQETFGAENVHGLTVHKDEVHDYMDKSGQTRTSMIHAHGIITPYAYWNDKAGHEHEGINGKHFITRDMLKDFNRTLNDKCLQRFGYELNTHGLPQRKSVEQLKLESTALNSQSIIDRTLDAIKKVKDELAAYITKKNNLNEDIDQLESYKDALNDTIDSLEHGALDLARDIVDRGLYEHDYQEHNR